MGMSRSEVRNLLRDTFATGVREGQITQSTADAYLESAIDIYYEAYKRGDPNPIRLVGEYLRDSGVTICQSSSSQQNTCSVSYADSDTIELRKARKKAKESIEMANNALSILLKDSTELTSDKINNNQDSQLAAALRREIDRVEFIMKNDISYDYILEVARGLNKLCEPVLYRDNKILLEARNKKNKAIGMANSAISLLELTPDSIPKDKRDSAHTWIKILREDIYNIIMIDDKDVDSILEAAMKLYNLSYKAMEESDYVQQFVYRK